MDIALEQTFDIKFNTQDLSSPPVLTTFAGSPAFEIYEDNSTTQITGAVTLTVDFDGITGLNNLRVAATTANGFEEGKSYSVVCSAGTVDGNSMVGQVLFEFTIKRDAVNATADAIKAKTDSLAFTSGNLHVDVKAWNEVLLSSTDPFSTVVGNQTTINNNLGSLIVTVGIAGNGLSAIPWNADWDAQVQSEVQDAIEANHLDHLFAAAYDPTSKPGNASGLLNVLVENDGGVPRYTTNALEQGPSGGTPPSAAAIADAVWDEQLSGHTDSGSAGEAMASAGSGSLAGSGADQMTITIQDSSSNPVEDAQVWLTSDSAGSVVVAGTLVTNASGQVQFLVTAGSTYYLWAQKAGRVSIQGTSFTAVAD